jgi:biotin carboxyl carrier protein
MAKIKKGNFQMKKFSININGKDIHGDCLLNENNFIVNDISNKFDYKFITDDIILLRINNNNYIIKSEKDTDSEVANTLFDVELLGTSYKVSCKSELDILVEAFSKNRSGGKIKNDVISPMPGGIVKINVKEGQSVKKGEVLLVLEAMKMENEIKALADCKIQKILVEEKKSVEKGQMLMKLEPLAAE